MIVTMMIAKYRKSRTVSKISEMNNSSRIRGPMESSMNRSRNSTPFTPRSITRDKPPVFRVM